jgi:deoxyribose-phosphate aldolase
MDNLELAKYLDSTNLNKNATRKEINRMINDAIKYGFGGLCIDTSWVSYVQNKLDILGAKDIAVMTVPNFSMGGGLEAMSGIAESCCDTCSEVDYILNTYTFGELKNFEDTLAELKKVREMTKGELKVIIESYYLRVSDDKVHKQGMDKVIKKACKLVKESGADWIKTDSGLFKRPEFDTLLEDCKLMVKYADGLKVKAAGGVSSKFQVEELIKAGVSRIGTSRAVDIVTSTVSV